MRNNKDLLRRSTDVSVFLTGKHCNLERAKDISDKNIEKKNWER